MSFRLQTAEAVPEGIQRIAAEQLAGAVQELNDRRRNRHKAIHAARQHCKRMRAVLRLVQRDLSDQYSLENRCFRNIARELSDVRDAEAVIETLDKLHAECKNQRETELLRAARRTLIARRQQVASGDQGLAEHAAQAAEALRAAHERLASWPLRTSGFRLLAPGIQKTYAKSRKAFAKAYREPSDARFHEARKCVKYLWYQMRIVNNIWPDAMRAYRRALKSLSDLLGDDHDLTVLSTVLREHPQTFTGARLEDMLSLIERRRTLLKAQAHILGRRILAERPAQFRKRLCHYWRAWQEEADPLVEKEPGTVELEQRAVA